MLTDAQGAPQGFGRELANSPLTVTAILEILQGWIEPICQSATVEVLLYDPGSKRYTVRQAGHAGAYQEGDYGFDHDSSLAHWLRKADRPIYLPESPGAAVPLFSGRESSTIGAPGMVLFLPLQGRGDPAAPDGRLLGWIALGPRPSGEAYSPEEVEILAAMADQVSLPIEASRLRESVQEANQAQSEFIDFVAHELKQPMTAIQGYAKMLMMGLSGELNETQQQFVEVINKNIARMGKLINDLLEISRLEAGRIELKLAPVPVTEIVEETLASSSSEIKARNHSLKVDILEDLPPALGDRERLVQILTHLVSNAKKYTPDGGTVLITAGRQNRPEAQPMQLLVAVSDTGIGMSPEEMAALEEKFFRADHDLVHTQPGTGLGVSIARHLIQLHGGELTVESKVGQGSTFSFTIPIAPEQEFPQASRYRE